jgi:hypothetical protein
MSSRRLSSNNYGDTVDRGNLDDSTIRRTEAESRQRSKNSKKNYRKGVRDTILVLAAIAGLGVGGYFISKGISNRVQAKRAEEAAHQAEHELIMDFIENQYPADLEAIMNQFELQGLRDDDQDSRIMLLEDDVRTNYEDLNLKFNQIRTTINQYGLSQENADQIRLLLDRMDDLYADNQIFQEFKTETERILDAYDGRLNELDARHDAQDSRQDSQDSRLDSLESTANIDDSEPRYDVNVVYGNDKIQEVFSLSQYENGITVDELLSEIDAVEGYNVQARYVELPDGQLLINFGHRDMEPGSLNVYLSKNDEHNEEQETYQKAIIDNWADNVPTGNFRTLSRGELRELLDERMAQYPSNLVLVNDNLTNLDDIDAYMTFGPEPNTRHRGKYLELMD